MEATSKAVQKRGVDGGLSQLKRRFDQWRAGRKVGERIPVELWAGAVASAVEHGVYRVAAELHLDYAVLKRRAHWLVARHLLASWRRGLSSCSHRPGRRGRL